MRSLLRCLLFVLATACGVAHADGTVPSTSGYNWTGQWGSPVTLHTDSTGELSLCQSSVAYYNSLRTTGDHPNNGVASVTNPGTDTGACNVKDAYWGPIGGFTWTRVSVQNCPANSTLSGGSCSCSPGYGPGDSGTALQGLCVPPTNCTPGLQLSTGWYDIGTNVTAQQSAACQGGCAYAFDGFSASKWTLEAGVKHYWAKGTYTSTGSKCGGGSTDPTQAPAAPPALPEPPPSTCPVGQAPGTINGNPVCAPTGGPPGTTSPVPGTPTTEPTTTTTTNGPTVTNPDGTTTTTTTTITTAPDGTKSSTVTTTTKNPDGTTKGTTTTTTGGNGSSAGGTGTGNTGNGAGSGCSNGEVECEGGTPATVPNDLYTKKEETFQAVANRTKEAVLAAPAIALAASFFNVGGGGACPQSSWHIPFVNADVPFDMFCGQMAGNALALMGAVVLVLAAWASFRIAFL